MVPTSGGFGSETKPYVYAKCPPKGNRDHPADVDHACPAPLKDREWPRINAEPAACPLPPLRTSRLSAPPASGAAPTSRPPPTPVYRYTPCHPFSYSYVPNPSVPPSPMKRLDPYPAVLTLPSGEPGEPVTVTGAKTKSSTTQYGWSGPVPLLETHFPVSPVAPSSSTTWTVPTW